MKAISASIVVLAAAVMISGGASIEHDDTQMFVMGVGCVVGFLGVLSWIGAFLDKEN